MITLGAHLSSDRPGYTHHGIYVGNGKVIHYSGLSNGLSKGCICETTLAEFVGGKNEVTIITHSNADRIYTPVQVVARARARLGEDAYNVIFNNCEHFATWCVTGKAESKQVKSKVKLASNASNAYNAFRAYQTYKTLKTAKTVGGPVIQMVSQGAAVSAGSTPLTSLVATASGTGMTTAALSGTAGTSALAGIASSSVAAATAPVALAVGGVALAGYGVYKLWSWLSD
ncbi:lecithin retinol acyltransferase family protein [Escherichia coli]|uniref:lecithin retinol acyltransferase family protein n=1 Tax=Escherichia coli TaxID=562 RepID=UPI0006672E73|nr:lecithin retinol acyltransferase family protein [Escherichia coli]EGJ8836595.1 lecithin retinol acyltransferase family protein [Salmonella enterica]EGO4308601.1 lecithin retinol acyltransferase family protein [Escherichia coli]EKC8925775.1 lecithin retinol acyltransferase family protein [Escherichia coli]